MEKIHAIKTILLFIVLCAITTGTYSQKSGHSTHSIEPVSESHKKVDITIVINGATVRITGHVRFNMLTSTLVFEGSITVSGNGSTVELPVNYNGPLKKGPFQHQYNDTEILLEDRMFVGWALSRLHLMRGGKAEFYAGADQRADNIRN